MASTPIQSKYAKDVTPENVLQEYPRPQMVRTEWKNLNGLWSFARMNDYEDATPTTFSEILVPFCPESPLSGIKVHYTNMCYKRTINVPTSWSNKRTILHFEAVDWKCNVFIDGEKIGSHQGGYDPFEFDITDYVKPGTNQELMLKVYDPTDYASNPRGKQVTNRGGINYTPCSGIWETVWLEPVEKTYIADYRAIPDIDNSQLKVNITTGGDNNAQNYTITIYHSGVKVAEETANVTEQLTLNIPNPEYWSPDHPYLYDMDITLKNADGTTDIVKSYFGMRKISKKQDTDGFWKVQLNNEYIFQIGPLDQGYWPEGIYTAPTDEALKSDIVMMKRMGFNSVRKHVKVEPRRWYYWCDKLGLMVWQDMPGMNYSGSPTGTPIENNYDWFKLELDAMVRKHINSPSIVTWVIFNEGGGQGGNSKYSCSAITKECVSFIGDIDDSRLINEASGWTACGYGDYKDNHTYPTPTAVSTSNKMVTACGEYGGWQYPYQGHLWGSGSFGGYTVLKDVKELDSLYTEHGATLSELRDRYGLSSAIYTQITDVETEINGLMTYDRILKGNLDKIYKSNRMAICGTSKKKEYILKPANEGGETWSYTFNQPAASWFQKNFDDNSWSTGLSGFGGNGLNNMRVRTSWRTDNIWLRKKIDFNLTDEELKKLTMKIYYDEDCEVYINGLLAFSATGYITDYKTVSIPSGVLKTIDPKGTNYIAIHCKQTAGGQFIDMGLFLQESYKEEIPAKQMLINMDYTNSSEISFEVGYSTDINAIEPENTKTFTNISFANIEENIVAMGLSDNLLLSPKDLAFDITPLFKDINLTKPIKLFIKVKTSPYATGNGHIYKATIIDNDENISIPFIGGETELTKNGIILIYTINPISLNAPRNTYIENNILHWDTPAPSSCTITGYSIYENGKEIAKVNKDVFSYTECTNKNSSYSVTTIYEEGISKAGEIAERIDKEPFQNIVRHFKSSGFLLKNILKDEMPNATIEYWINPDNITDSTNFIGKGYGYYLGSFTSAKRFESAWENRSSEKVSVVAGAVTEKKWNHIAITFETSKSSCTMKVYINGILKGSKSSSNHLGLTAMNDFYFGYDKGLMEGQIDEVKIWNVAKSFSEVVKDKLYETSMPETQEHLVAYYKMDEILDNGVIKLRDASKNGNHALYLGNGSHEAIIDNTFLTESPSGDISADIDVVEESIIGKEIIAKAKLSDNVASWKWEVEGLDKNIPSIHNASLVFNEPREYKILLTAYDATKEKCVQAEKIIKVVNASLPEPNFSYSISYDNGTALVHLLNHTESNIVDYKWTMPGSISGESIADYNTSATYNKSGKYDITLTISNVAGNKQLTKSITIDNILNFSVNPPSVLKNGKTYLTEENESTSENLVWTIENDKFKELIIGGCTSYTPTKPGLYNITLTNKSTGSNKSIKGGLTVCNDSSHLGIRFSNKGESIKLNNTLASKNYRFTIEWWMKPDQQNNCIRFNAGNNIFTVNVNQNGNMEINTNDKIAYSGNNFIIPEEWHHYAISFTSKKMTFYRDGEEITNETSVLSVPAFENGITIEGLNTTIDELRIYASNISIDNLANNCNKRLTDITSATTDLKLVAYYQFNTIGAITDLVSGNQADIKTFTSQSWIPSDGVFSLSEKNEEQLHREDITSTYLTNYQSEFLHSAKPIQNNIYELESGTKNSTWKGDIMTADTEGAFVDGNDLNRLSVQSGWNELPESISNYTLYQTLDLPIGVYTLEVETTTNDNNHGCCLVANEGANLYGNNQLTNAYAYSPLNKGKLEFNVCSEDNTSIGILYNLPYCGVATINKLSLYKEPYIVTKANGEIPTAIKTTTQHKSKIRIKNGTIEATGENTPLKIYNILGNLIVNKTINGTDKINLPTGIYI
ncbi:MAG: DUF5013 domain-containing protein, partial [Prevotellaceae bacterium]|nr:DUF5013 domain-containing protein [Candidatus Faecinaster equi]